ncbi:LysR family transcriptional regulator [Pseudomonas fuscovaginae UPB0736]|uniref:LysR family transcriptional regulator n=1 Tax=Pseudomonas asplenii TaxID=53407 RepID=UPI000287E063|nr:MULTISPECIES: LysR family transcriptional regulator [Pseudomonas]UUQ63249.1 LysR family transcriptional regulator [Pseudomonas fuscovaginae UPB0736]UZE28240.1 LysR family transcriptional regulator [Pseudomonas asplenii]
MEFKQLRSFVEVVHQGGFTQAAKTLHISQSAVSKQVAQLEHSLGVTLLDRQGPKVLPTAAGRVVLQRAEEMLRLRSGLLHELDDLSQLARGELRLGLPQLGGDTVFAGLFAEYRRRYPNIAIQLLEGGSLSIEPAVLSGELELGAGLTPNNPAFDCQPFCDEPLDVLLAIDHPLAEEGSIRLEQLADTPFLLYQRSFVLTHRLIQACERLGFTPKESGRSGQADFLAALVAAGQGVALMPSVVARSLVRPGVVRLSLSSPTDLRWDIAFIWRRGAYLSQAAQAWLALLRERPISLSVR